VRQPPPSTTPPRPKGSGDDGGGAEEATLPQIGGFRVLRRLASGGTSDIFLARAGGPHGFERVVVLKVLLQRFRNEPAFERMFAREASAYARLSHPAIVKLFDFFSTEGQLVMVLEHVDGLPLNKLRAMLSITGDKLDDRAAIFVASRVFAALAAAHSAKDPETGEFAPVIHRDINPSNVLVPWDGHVKLADFGIAKVTGMQGDTKTGFIKGTYGYMAPEQVRGETVTGRADVYAATLLLWELLTRRKAIQRGALPEVEVLKAMAKPQFPSLDSIRPELDVVVRDAVRRGLEPVADRRSITAEEMAGILRTAIQGGEEARLLLVDSLARVRPTPAAELDVTLSRLRPTSAQEADTTRGPIPARSKPAVTTATPTPTHPSAPSTARAQAGAPPLRGAEPRPAAVVQSKVERPAQSMTLPFGEVARAPAGGAEGPAKPQATLPSPKTLAFGSIGSLGARPPGAGVPRPRPSAPASSSPMSAAPSSGPTLPGGLVAPSNETPASASDAPHDTDESAAVPSGARHDEASRSGAPTPQVAAPGRIPTPQLPFQVPVAPAEPAPAPPAPLGTPARANPGQASTLISPTGADAAVPQTAQPSVWGRPPTEPGFLPPQPWVDQRATTVVGPKPVAPRRRLGVWALVALFVALVAGGSLGYFGFFWRPTRGFAFHIGSHRFHVGRAPASAVTSAASAAHSAAAAPGPPSASVAAPLAPSSSAIADGTKPAASTGDTTKPPTPPVASAAVDTPKPATTATDTPDTTKPTDGGGDLVVSNPGHRVYVDGHIVGQSPGTFHVKCGTRVVHIGSSQAPKNVAVPCGGSVEL
jgi:serine/threonine protein kinase